MGRLAQLGVLSTALGAVAFFLGFFPDAIGAERAPGIGPSQMAFVLLGLFLIVLGAYVVVYALLHRGRPSNLLSDIAVRLGMTGFVVAAASVMSDLLGYGSHTGEVAPVFGWLQAVGLAIGFLIASFGVLLYGYARSR